MAHLRALLISLCLGLAVVGVAGATANAASTPAGWLEKAGDRARDCVGDTSVHERKSDGISFTVWCGVESGRVRFTLRRATDGLIEDFSGRPAVGGGGAVAPFRCYRSDEVIRCIGRKQGPVKVQGWITVEEGSRCSVAMGLDTHSLTDIGKPQGCPGVSSIRPPRNIRHIREFRRSYGLDPDLHGDRAAIDQRIRRLIRAWERGDPVARYTAESWGVPLRARDQRELDYRDEYLEQTSNELSQWVALHAQATYAGYAMDHEHGGTIFVGFVGDQQAQMEAFLDSFDSIAPDRIRPFPVVPRYSMAYLVDLQIQIGRAMGRLRMTGRVGIDLLGNFVEISTVDVDAVQRLIAETYGSEAPVAVVYGRPPVPKSMKRAGAASR